MMIWGMRRGSGKKSLQNFAPGASIALYWIVTRRQWMMVKAYSPYGEGRSIIHWLKMSNLFLITTNDKSHRQNLIAALILGHCNWMMSCWEGAAKAVQERPFQFFGSTGFNFALNSVSCFTNKRFLPLSGKFSVIGFRGALLCEGLFF